MSGEPTGANCGRSEVLRGYEDGGRGPDRVAMFDDAGGPTVMQAEGGMGRETSGVLAGKARSPEKDA